MAKVNTYETAAGVSEHPWINKPDTKYNADGVFKNALWLDAAVPTTQNLMALVDDACEEAFKVELKDLTPAERKKWSIYKPYEVEMDAETGETATGRVKFNFKRNHTIHLQGGETKELSVAVYDSSGKLIDDEALPAIYTGTVMKVLFTMRNIKVGTSKQVGVKLDFPAVKIMQLSKGGRSGDPFAKDAPDGDEDTGHGYVYSPSDTRHRDDNEEHDDSAEF